ncbi:MAG TPA: bifunctional oligoribonuclease/PAP phosphatase NrnA [Pirellulales bacterium]
MTIDWRRFADRIHALDRFVLTTHQRPDGDAIGSEMGMYHVLTSLGKSVRIVNADEVPPKLRFLDPLNTIETLSSLREEERRFADVGCFLVLDTSAWSQLAGMGDALRATNAAKLVLDHHQIGDDLGAEEFKDVDAEACGRLVYDAAQALGVPLTQAIAQPLLAAIATDTGWYRFPSTKPLTLRVVADLMEAGASPSVVHREIYEQESLPRLRLLGRTLAGMTSECDGRLMVLGVREGDFASTGAVRHDVEDLANQGLRVSSAAAAVSLVEQSDGKSVKASFRSRWPSLDVSRLAQQFGGGGHKAASGATLSLPFEEARTQIIAAFHAGFATAAPPASPGR